MPRFTREAMPHSGSRGTKWQDERAHPSSLIHALNGRGLGEKTLINPLP